MPRMKSSVQLQYQNIPLYLKLVLIVSAVLAPFSVSSFEVYSGVRGGRKSSLFNNYHPNHGEYSHMLDRRNLWSQCKNKRNLAILYSLHNAQDAGNDAAEEQKGEKIIIIGAGWGGLSAAHALSRANKNKDMKITMIDASPKVGGLVRDGFTTMSGTRPAEAGQHGFWDNYYNIFSLLKNDLSHVLDIDSCLTGYAEQGQYSPKGLEAVWPVYRNMNPSLPTGLAQALYTKFTNLPWLDRLSAGPLVLAFSEFDDSAEAWSKYDNISFRELCVKLGVTRRCYEEAFEPMILTGLFAPGAECSAAAALGMAYFFVLKSQNSFDVRWCKGNIGEQIFDRWVEDLQDNGVEFLLSTRVTGFESSSEDKGITSVKCQQRSGDSESTVKLDADKVIFAVSAGALNAIVRNSPLLSTKADFRRYANLRGTSVLATRIFLDRNIPTKYTANACWGFDKRVGMTVFDITKLHELTDSPGSVMEVDYYHSNALNIMSDEAIVEKVKADLDTIFGQSCQDANVVDAAIIRLNQGVNWYFPGSYASMPDTKSESICNVYFAGDLVRSRHGSWSQEKAYVTGIEAANAILGRPSDFDIIPLSPDELHVAAGRQAVSLAKTVLGAGDSSRAPSITDFLF